MSATETPSAHAIRLAETIETMAGTGFPATRSALHQARHAAIVREAARRIDILAELTGIPVDLLALRAARLQGAMTQVAETDPA